MFFHGSDIKSVTFFEEIKTPIAIEAHDLLTKLTFFDKIRLRKANKA